MLVHSNIKASFQVELIQAKSIWIASAMISHSGWAFLQENLRKNTIQYYLIGIDLATDPSVFESIIENTEINARIYETKYTFHPKVYIFQRDDNSFTAFIGSSNTTNWGLEKNTEMNFQISDQIECAKLVAWFTQLYSRGYLITEKFVNDYKLGFARASVVAKEIEKEATVIKSGLTKGKGQFFTQTEHEIFDERYHYSNSKDLQNTRKEVRDKFLKLHKTIFPQFSAYGLTDLHCHHQPREIVSRHFFNRYSGYYINSIWLHYGKSLEQLHAYSNEDKSINRPDSFINNIRMQVIIHKDSLGIWLVLGRNNGSKKDREHFRKQMNDLILQKKFFDAFKNLGDEYWINVPDAQISENIKTTSDLLVEIYKEKLEKYFTIGCDIDWLDDRLSIKNISTTILKEFRKLYPLYEIMRHQ